MIGCYLFYLISQLNKNKSQPIIGLTGGILQLFLGVELLCKFSTEYQTCRNVVLLF